MNEWMLSDNPHKDWPEDFGLENGNYWHKCPACAEGFTGHKRRLKCKECSNKIDPEAEKMADKVIQKSRKGGKFRPINISITEQQAIDYLTSLGYVVTKPVDVRSQWDEEHF